MINKFISGLKPNQRKVLAVVSVVVILGLFLGIFLWPAWNRSKEIDHLILKEQETIRKNSRFLARRDNVIKEAGVYRDYFTKDVRAEEEVMADLLKKVELLATKSGVQMSKTATSGKESQNDYLQYFISVDCSGTLENLTNFIYAINNSTELTRVEKMNLASNAKSVDIIQASLTISKMIIGADPSVDASKLVRVQEGKEAAKPAAAPKE